MDSAQVIIHALDRCSLYFPSVTTLLFLIMNIYSLGCTLALWGIYTSADGHVFLQVGTELFLQRGNSNFVPEPGNVTFSRRNFVKVC